MYPNLSHIVLQSICPFCETGKKRPANRKGEKSGGKEREKGEENERLGGRKSDGPKIDNIH